VEPFSDSLVMVGGVHRVGVPTVATPCGAVPGLAHDYGRRAPAIVRTWMKEEPTMMTAFVVDLGKREVR
jgi:hypothetical protein